MRDPRDKFKNVNAVYASAGVKISSPGLEIALAGAPVRVAPAGKENQILEEVNSELESFRIRSRLPRRSDCVSGNCD